MLWTARTCSTKAERRFSPLGRAADGTALLMTGVLDRRTPMPQTEEYYAALKVKGVPVKLLQFNEEYHGTGSKPSNYIRTQLYMMSWFTQWTRAAGGRATTTAAAQP